MLSPTPGSFLSRSVHIDANNAVVRGVRTSTDRVGVRVNGECALVEESELSGHTFGSQMAGARGIARRNVVRGSVELAIDVQGPGIRLDDNMAIGGATGIQDSGTATRLQRNVAAGNSLDGFVLNGNGAILAGNVASGNGQYGFREVGQAAAASIVGNTAEGNVQSGFLVSSSDGDRLRFRNNSTYNNAECGLQYLPSAPLTARGNWWGTSSLPSSGQAPGPADVCLPPGATVNVVPSARERPIRIRGDL